MTHTIILKNPQVFKINGILDFHLHTDKDRIIINIDAPTINEAKQKVLSVLEGVVLE